EMVGPGRDRVAPVRLLETQRHPGVAGLVHRDEGDRDPAGSLRVHRVRARRAGLLPGVDPPDLRVDLVFRDAEPGIDPVPDVGRAGRAQSGTRLRVEILRAV